MMVSIDLGHGFVKAVTEAGGVAVFPSVVARLQENGAIYDDDREAMEVDLGRGRERLVVGDLARHLPMNCRPWGYSGRAREAKELLAGALVQLGVEGVFDLAVLLPLQSVSATEVRETRTALAGWTVANWRDGVLSSRTTARVEVLPQAVGAYLAECYEVARGGVSMRPGAEGLRTGTVAVVDIGHRTVDVLYVQEGRIVRGHSGTMESGMYHVVAQMARRVSARVGVPVPEVVAEDAVLSGSLACQGQGLDVTAVRDELLRALADMVYGEVARVIGPELSFVRRTLVTGGGAGVLRKYLEGRLPGIVVSDQLANARGGLVWLALSGKTGG